METTRFTDTKLFLDVVQSTLIEKEAENNLMLGLLVKLAKNNNNDDALKVGITDEGKPVLFALMTPPFPVIIWTRNSKYLPKLASWLVENEIRPAGVIAEAVTSKKFAEVWQQETGQNYNISMEQRILQIDKLVPPARPASGKMIPATLNDLDLCADWYNAFVQEADPSDQHSDQTQHTKAMIEAGQLFLWIDNNQPVTLVGQIRQLPNGAVVGPVYTPAEFRKNGYASSATAALTERLLAGGNVFCCLFTDKTNQTSNKIYEAIGYQETAQSCHHRFL